MDSPPLILFLRRSSSIVTLTSTDFSSSSPGTPGPLPLFSPRSTLFFCPGPRCTITPPYVPPIRPCHQRYGARPPRFRSLGRMHQAAADLVVPCLLEYSHVSRIGFAVTLSLVQKPATLSRRHNKLQPCRCARTVPCRQRNACTTYRPRQRCCKLGFPRHPSCLTVLHAPNVQEFTQCRD
jgi:hypothetical protein